MPSNPATTNPTMNGSPQTNPGSRKPSADAAHAPNTHQIARTTTVIASHRMDRECSAWQ